MSGNFRRRALTVLLVGLALGSGIAFAPPSAFAAGYSASALYNQGNAYARQGKRGLAALDYERARLLAPNDRDIAANLDHLGVDGTGSWLEQHARFGTPNLLFWLGVAGLAVTAASVLTWRFVPRRRRVARLSVAVGIAMASVCVCDAVATWPIRQEAVVLQATVARSAPASDSDNLFALPEASIVKIVDVYRGFSLVRTAAGQSGWVARTDVAPVVIQNEADAERTSSTRKSTENIAPSPGALATVTSP